MIYYLKGILVEASPARIVVDVNGVGYEVFISLASFDRLPAVGSEMVVYCYEYLREDVHVLYGFITLEEKEMFEELITVNGVGPKIAMNILSGISIQELKTAIVEADIKKISSLHGVGKKTAERIIVEMKHRLKDSDVIEQVSKSSEKTANIFKDAVLAMVTLGYKSEQARKLVRKVIESRRGEELTVEDIIKQALTMQVD